MVNALRVYQPAISKVFERLLPYYYTDKEQEMINQNFPLCENISVDYAIMEKADEILSFLPALDGVIWVLGDRCTRICRKMPIIIRR